MTDYLLALECAFFAWALHGGWRQVEQGFFASFFGVTALASTTGGTYHLFFPESSSLPAELLWKATVVAMGAVAFAAWSIGASLLFAQLTQSRIIKAAAVEFLLYCIYVVAVDDRFVVAVANYIPAALFLALTFALRYWRHREARILAGLAGLGVTGVAAAVQRSGLGLHPLYFNHNATYHVIQAIGFLLIFIAAVFFARVPGQTARRRS